MLPALAATVVAILAAMSLDPPRPAQPPLAARLAWMTGCWERRAGARVIEEQWMAPRAGTLLGVSRTVSGDSVVEFEFMRITERGGRLTFAAWPQGQGPGEFQSTTVDDSSVAFANPAHDFPQHVRYRRHGPDSLAARIEGSRGGTAMAVDFPFARVACR